MDRVVLITGQNVESVNDYVTNVGVCPGGIMSYTSTANAEGLNVDASYGAGDIFAEYFVTNQAYTNTVIQMGLYINNDLANITSGARDTNIAAIGNWIKNVGRPVYLRIGYEFDGPWNVLDPTQYVAAYQYIVNAMRANNVTNVSFVWHSCCAPTYNNYPFTNWYPGDRYVDWAGISVYQQFSGTLGTVANIESFCSFAQTHNKPIMIAESAPYGGITDATWTNWFVPCMQVISRHHIQMWCYISTDWDLLSLFAGQGWGNTQIELDPLVESNWIAQVVNNPAVLNQSAQLYPRLHVDATNSWEEAENAILSGTSVFADANASGGAAVTGLSLPGNSVTFTNGAEAMQMLMHYSASSAGTIGLYINAMRRRTLPFNATASGTYADLLVHAGLPPGATVKIQFDQGDAPLNLDYVLFRGYRDSSGDGLPDDWKLWHFGTLSYGPNDDPDGDGSVNYSEFVADTDPMNWRSALRITGVTMNSGQPTITFQAPPNRTVFIQQSDDLVNWTYPTVSISSNMPAINAVVSNPPPGKLFYRLVVP